MKGIRNSALILALILNLSFFAGCSSTNTTKTETGTTKPATSTSTRTSTTMPTTTKETSSTVIHYKGESITRVGEKCAYGAKNILLTNNPKWRDFDVYLYGYSYLNGKFTAYLEFVNDTKTDFDYLFIVYNAPEISVTASNGQIVSMINKDSWKSRFSAFRLPAGTKHIETFAATGLTASPKSLNIAGMITTLSSGTQTDYPAVVFPQIVKPNVDIGEMFGSIVKDKNISEINSAIIKEITYTPNGGTIKLDIKSDKYSTYYTALQTQDFKFDLITDQNEGIALIPTYPKVQLQNGQIPANQVVALTLKFSTGLKTNAESARIKITGTYKASDQVFVQDYSYPSASSIAFKLK